MSQNITLQQAKTIVESKGLNFEDFRQESINELQLDIINKRGMYKDIVNDLLIAKAFNMLMEDITETKKKTNTHVPMPNENKLKEEQLKGEQ